MKFVLQNKNVHKVFLNRKVAFKDYRTQSTNTAYLPTAMLTLRGYFSQMISNSAIVKKSLSFLKDR